MSLRLFVGGTAAILLAPPLAGFFAALVFATVVVWDSSRGGGPEVYVGGVALITIVATVATAPFTIAFTLLTQLPLTFLYRRIGFPTGTRHVLISAVLGTGAFVTLFPLMLGGGSWSIDTDTERGRQELLLALAMGAAGGAAVGLLWHLLVLRPLGRGALPDTGCRDPGVG